jgi:hypothetical protein
MSSILLDAPAGGKLLLRTSQKQSLCYSPCLSLPIFLKDFSVMVPHQPLLANSGLKAIPTLEEFMLPPCVLKPSPVFIQ